MNAAANILDESSGQIFEMDIDRETPSALSVATMQANAGYYAGIHRFLRGEAIVG